MPEPAKDRTMVLLEFMLTAAGLVAVFLVLDISIPASCSGSNCKPEEFLSYNLSEGLGLFVLGAVLLYVVHLYGHPIRGPRGTVSRAIPTILVSVGFSVLLVTLFGYGQLGLGFTSITLYSLYALYGVVAFFIFVFIEYGDAIFQRITERQNQVGA